MYKILWLLLVHLLLTHFGDLMIHFDHHQLVYVFLECMGSH